MRLESNYVLACFLRIRKRRFEKSLGSVHVKKCSDGSIATDYFSAMRKVFPSPSIYPKITKVGRRMAYERIRHLIRDVH
jgi:hypothetical protein